MNTSGFASTTISSTEGSHFRKSGVRISIVVSGARCRIARIVWAKWAAPPSSTSSRSTLVTTTCFSPSLATASATRPGSNGSSASGGLPVAMLQKVQARVQTSPMIIMVAWPWLQHSPTFGQPASSQTVTSLCSRMIAAVAL